MTWGDFASGEQPKNRSYQNNLLVLEEIADTRENKNSQNKKQLQKVEIFN